jgi:hypothetical protein
MCCNIFSRTCVLPCSALVSTTISASRTSIFYPAMSSDSVPHQTLGPRCWKSECLEDLSYPGPITHKLKVLQLWREGALCQSMPQPAHSRQSASYSYTYPYPWSQLHSCCCQVELCQRESQSCHCEGIPGSARCCPLYVSYQRYFSSCAI